MLPDSGFLRSGLFRSGKVRGAILRSNVNFVEKLNFRPLSKMVLYLAFKDIFTAIKAKWLITFVI
jgi:hypothetical protein